ncbi:MAG: alpha-amylase/4-alpha-glucanotransferase domain-containing protein [Desulfurococcaceae archaeon]
MALANFVFALHFHQPYGQIRAVSEGIFSRSYALLIEVMEEYSDLDFVVHVSGPLLLYLRERHPEWLGSLRRLAEAGTVELLSGTFGEAVLSLFPEDAERQIKRYAELAEELFGFRPRGFWLPERVWEPWLPKVLATNGIEYVLLDDSLLTRAGKPEELATRAWQTEYGGYTVKVLFIDTRLRYILPWNRPEEVISYMRSRTRAPDSLFVWGSDAEKFGEWADPGWSRWWLTSFLELLRKGYDVAMVHASKYLKEHGVAGLLYMPHGSYDKMLEWSGGHFLNFLTKYPEANNMHKKLLWVRRKARSLEELPKELQDLYLLAECNDAYWHGLFGGVYLAHLRQAIYEALIKVEREAERLTGYFEGRPSRQALVDFDFDGRDELLLETPSINLYADPADGGTIFELDIKRPGLEHNLQDTMTRRAEPYLGPEFRPDWYRRTSFRLHFYGAETTLRDWIDNAPFKDMSDLATKEHEVIVRGPLEFSMRTVGHVYVFGQRALDVFVDKAVSVKEDGISMAYTVRGISGSAVYGKLGIEYHVAPKLDRHEERAIKYRVNGTEKDYTESFAGSGRVVEVLSPGYPPIRLEAGSEHEVWVSPLESYSRTEKGLRKSFQGIAVMFMVPVEMAPGRSVADKVELSVVG